MAWPFPLWLAAQLNSSLHSRLNFGRSRTHASVTHCRRQAQAQQRGFTLIEVLVALGIMALLAVMSWRGLDALLRAARVTREHSTALLGLQAGLMQWKIDLDQRVQAPYLPALDWDGRVLRLLRTSPAGGDEAWQVVAWTQGLVAGSLQWARWQSAPLTRRAELLDAWQQAAVWARAAGELTAANDSREAGDSAASASSGDSAGASDSARTSAVAITPLIGWQLLHYREGQWVRVESLSVPARQTDTAARPRTAAPPAGELAAGAVAAGPLAPEGLRLLLDLPPTGSLQGQLVIDWFNPLNSPTSLASQNSQNSENAGSSANPLNQAPGTPR